MRHLFLTQDYAPDLGGMARRHVEIARRLPAGSRVSTVHAPGSMEADAAEPTPVHRMPFDFRHAGRLGSQIQWARWLSAHAGEFDVVHCANIRPCGYAAWWAWKRARLPYLVYVNGLDLLRERQKAKSALKRFTARHILGEARGIIANSLWTGALAAEVMREVGVRELPPIADFPLGTDPQQFAPERADRAILERHGLVDVPYLLTVARLVPHKGHDVAIRALAAVASEFPALHYVIVGDGPHEATLRQLAAELGVASRVRFTGPLRDDQLPALHAGAALYVGLSRLLPPIQVEGFGISFVEAAASGVASLAGDSGGVRSAVLDGETGVVVPPEDVSAVAAALAGLMRDDARRRALGANGRRAVFERFNWDRVAADTIAFADACLAPRRAGR